MQIEETKIEKERADSAEKKLQEYTDTIDSLKAQLQEMKDDVQDQAIPKAFKKSAKNQKQETKRK